MSLRRSWRSWTSAGFVCKSIENAQWSSIKVEAEADHRRETSYLFWLADANGTAKLTLYERLGCAVTGRVMSREEKELGCVQNNGLAMCNHARQNLANRQGLATSSCGGPMFGHVVKSRSRMLLVE